LRLAESSRRAGGRYAHRALAAALSVRDLIDRASYGAIVILTGAMALAIIVQVALRYIFNASIDWADETARLTFIWVVFLAVPHGVKFGLHVGLDLVSVLSARVRAALATFTRIVLIGFLSVVGYQATSLAIRNWENEMTTIALPSGLFYVALAICCFHSLAHLLLGPPKPAADALPVGNR
jgi:TRAP-type C4-dicarboxylate transport system permease small subunit